MLHLVFESKLGHATDRHLPRHVGARNLYALVCSTRTKVIDANIIVAAGTYVVAIEVATSSNA